MNKFLLEKSAQFWKQNSHSLTHLFTQLFIYHPQILSEFIASSKVQVEKAEFKK